jgi:hypothetical protein
MGPFPPTEAAWVAPHSQSESRFPIAVNVHGKIDPANGDPGLDNKRRTNKHHAKSRPKTTQICHSSHKRVVLHRRANLIEQDQIAFGVSVRPFRRRTRHACTRKVRAGPLPFPLCRVDARCLHKAASLRPNVPGNWSGERVRGTVSYRPGESHPVHGSRDMGAKSSAIPLGDYQHFPDEV